jgi:predicted PurR-regulated permease PerM
VNLFGSSNLSYEARRSRHRRMFLTVSALCAAAIIVTSRAVLLPFVLGLVVAFVLTPAVMRVERLRVPRWGAILIVYALTLGAVGGFIALIVPSLFAEGRKLATEAPRLTAHVRDDWLPTVDARLSRWMGRETTTPEPLEPPPPTVPLSAFDVPEDAPPLPPPGPIHVKPRGDGSLDVMVGEGVQLRQMGEGVWRLEAVPEQQHMSSENVLKRAFTKAADYMSANSLEVLRYGQAVVGAISRGVFNLFMTLMLGGYMIYTHERIIRFFRELWPEELQVGFDRFLRRLDRGLAGVVRGQLIICLVNGVLSAIGFWLFDLKYWPILSIIAAVMSLIPIFGSILSTIPAVAIGLTQSPGTAFAVLAWVVGIHQLEANFLNPKIIGDQAKIHPVLVVFSLLVGEHFFGIAGALFAVPCLSVLQSIFLHFRESTMGLKDPTASVPPAAAHKASS